MDPFILVYKSIVAVYVRTATGEMEGSGGGVGKD